MPDSGAGQEPLRLDIGDDKDVVRVRQAVRVLAVEAKLPLVDQTKLVTAASELARNTLIHGGGGYATIAAVHNGRRGGVRAEFIDTGPGIVDLGLAFTDGYTTGSGLGLGLSGSRRLVDEFEIDSTPGAGTRIAVTKWAR
ncbi:ATP-binding protein [Dactylosporangium sp. CS-047395]|uniref:ATP-binding protein n=1 Tax=Dactylosporangium sp. CS-047395 TaxID=3239936 RepID=UPI003D8E1DF0